MTQASERAHVAPTEYGRMTAYVELATWRAIKREAGRRKIAPSELAGSLLDTAVAGADWAKEAKDD